MKRSPVSFALLLLSLSAARLPSFGQSGAFEQVPGSLSQISVGADGAVWGLDSNQNIFTYDPGAGQFVQVPGALTQIAVGNANAVWGLNAQGLIFRWDPNTQDWTYIPGFLKQIAVGADGDVWGLNASAQVWHYNRQAQAWGYVDTSQISIYQGVTRLAVGNDGAVYALVNSSPGYLDAFWYNPGTGRFTGLPMPVQQIDFMSIGTIAVGADGDLWSNGGYSFHYSPLSGQWNVSGGNNIAQLAVGSGANVWGLESPEQASPPVDGSIYRWNAQSQTWVQVPGALAQIAAGADGSVWGINSQGSVYHYTGSAQPYHTLTQIPGSFHQISVAPDGATFAVDANNLVYAFDPGTQTFQNIPGQPLAQLSVGSAGIVWGVDAAGGIWQMGQPPANVLNPANLFNNVAGELNRIAVNANESVFGINLYGQTYTYGQTSPNVNGWVNIPGTLAQLSLGVDGTVWGVNAQQQIYSYDRKTASWVNIPGSLVQISVGNAANIWGVNADQHVYRYAATGWVQIPGALLTQIAVAFDGAVWGVNAQGGLYRWDSATQTFDYIGQGVTNVAVGNDNVVFAYNTDTGAAYWYF
ncbi:MAG TPA: tectonin domain-containing protein [Bryobacteraceae bacterium]|jgi:hypothetical protein|nr:tectonin domain-containing protein [Bryobacteraceae bacterium]